MPTSQCKEKKEGKKGDKIRPRMDPFPQINHTLVTNTILFLKNCLFFHAVCACGSPWWHERRASTGHKPTQARDEIRNGGGVHRAGLDSTPGACKCTRRRDWHTEGGCYYCCALRLCWFKRGWTLDVHSVDGDSPFATAEAPSWRPDVAVRVGTVAMLERAFCVL